MLELNFSGYCPMTGSSEAVQVNYLDAGSKLIRGTYFCERKALNLCACDCPIVAEYAFNEFSK